MKTILIAEDNADLTKVLSLYLSSEGYNVLTSADGLEALSLFNDNQVDLIITDIMMPHLDGYALIKKVREISDVMIFALSAKNQDHDKILGLNIGADDYITKPYNPLEVVARVNSAFRRINSSQTKQTTLLLDGLKLDTNNVMAYKKDELLDLTITEFKILKLLLEHPGQILSKAKISEHVNGAYFENDENTITVHISRIREKIGKRSDGSEFIKTIRGLGYKIEK